MSDLKFKPGQKIRISHKDGRGVLSFHSGEIVAHVKDDVWRVTMGGFGMFFLIPEKDIEDAENKTQDQGGQASGDAGDNARV